jgi:carboxyl-terminal processing protease
MKTKPIILIAALLLAAATAPPVSTEAAAQLQRPVQRPSQRPGHPTPEEMREITSQFEKLSEFYRIMAGNYLDTIPWAPIVEKGIVAMLGELDPHSIYLTADEQKASNEELGGGFSGIGIEFNTLADTIIVVNTIAGGPAERVGLLPGDRITTIDKKTAVGMNRNDVPKYLRGPKGTKVEVGIVRRGTPALLDFTITRDDIPINTIDAAYKPDPRTGYIKVNRFGATTGREFAEAFAALNTPAPIEGLILDLRGNGGGFLPEAIRMSEFFLDRGQRIVSTEGNMYPTQAVDASTDGRFNRGRLIVLVDEISASASEIVAGAVQDWDRGIVMGRPTFGKGLVQREFPLADGSAVRLTIARYLTPTGRAIQRPYQRGHSDQYYLDHLALMNAAPGAGGAADSTAAVGPAYRTLRSGRTVYGGGGIRPDVVIPADTTAWSPYWSKLVRTGRLREFVQSHLDNHRAAITALYPDVETYIAGFDPAPLLPALVDYAAAHEIEPDPAGLETSRPWIEAQIKALIAQQLWETAAYYRVVHVTTDETFRAASALMRRWYDVGHGPQEPVTEELTAALSK